jgi:predicted dehydrogenase
MAKVKWGVLGCSGFARRRTIPALLQSPSVDLVGVASRTLEKAESFRSDFGLRRVFGSYEEMLRDPEIQAVYIPLPNSLHAEWMIKAAEHGKHCLTEKPFSSNAAEARTVAQAVARHHVLVMEGYMWRFHSQHVKARAAVDRGAIGTVRLVRASFTFPLTRMPNVRLEQSLSGGSIMDVGCYPISAARFYFGDEPISAFMRVETDPEYGVDMRAAGVLEFPQGWALIDCGFNLPSRTHLEIVGETGTIIIPQPWLPDPEAVLTINGESQKLASENQYVNEFEHLSRCIVEGSSLAYGPHDAIRQMAAIDAVRSSGRSGRPERVQS